MWHPSVERAAALKADRNALQSQVMSLPFVFQTDAGNTDSLPGGPAAPGSKYRLERAGPSSDASLAPHTMEVLLLRLKPGTQYKATVYPQADKGAGVRPDLNHSKCTLNCGLEELKQFVIIFNLSQCCETYELFTIKDHFCFSFEEYFRTLRIYQIQ